MESLGTRAQELKDWFALAIDRDTEAFNQVLAAIRLPRKSIEDQQARDTAIAAANLDATLVPLEVLENAAIALGLALTAAQEGNPNSVSDAGVAGACAVAAAAGASLNVRINLPGLTEDQRQGIQSRHDTALEAASGLGHEVAATVDTVLRGER